MTEVAFQSSSPSVIKTILEVDLVSYADIARALEEALDIEAVRNFEDQIQEFIDYGLVTVGLQRGDVVLATAGDNAILLFDDAITMHRFAEAVQNKSLDHNNQRSIELAKRWFRMGAATGLVQMLSERRIVGTTIARAVRLEAAASKGELVVDVETFKALPKEVTRFYGSEETIAGKRDERFRGYRYTIIQIPAQNGDAVGVSRRGTKQSILPTREQLTVLYDLYRTCYLNQKYYGFRLDEAKTIRGRRVPVDYETLFKGYAEITSVLRHVVNDILVHKSVTKRAMINYRRVREKALELEKMDEPNPDRALVKRFEQEVKREIPVSRLWFPGENRNL